MGVLRRPKYEETETDKLIKRQMVTEEEDRVKKEEARAERKKRIAKGMVGSRSMFSKAGGRGFYDDEGNKY
tara:strand:- start:299 stop:511 length:213 start_codon:yes stop_codon:yes gene_type:complete